MARTGSAPSSGSRPGPCHGSCAVTGAAAGGADPITGEVIRASKATAVRYERDRPGELVHMDVKKLGRIPDGGGWRAHGRQLLKTGARRRTVVGFDYVHSLVDDHSRLGYCEVLPDEKGATCAAFLARAADYFAARGITRIEEVMTDNAWAYKHSLRQVVAALGARQIFIKAHCPWQNGKVERLNRTLLTEWAYRQVFTSNARTSRRPCALAGVLQHSTPPQRTRRAPAHQPAATNLMAGYI